MMNNLSIEDMNQDFIQIIWENVCNISFVIYEVIFRQFCLVILNIANALREIT